MLNICNASKIEYDVEAEARRVHWPDIDEYDVESEARRVHWPDIDELK